MRIVIGMKSVESSLETLLHSKKRVISSLILWQISMRESKCFKNSYTKKDARGDYSRGAGENCSR